MNSFVRAILFSAFVFAFAARADDVNAARESFQIGAKALTDGKPDEAVRAFEAAYAAKNAPSLFFFLGEAHRVAGHNDKAVEYYTKYISALPSGPKHAEAEAHLADLKKPTRKMTLAVGDLDVHAKPRAEKAPMKLAELPLEAKAREPRRAAKATASAAPPPLPALAAAAPPALPAPLPALPAPLPAAAVASPPAAAVASPPAPPPAAVPVIFVKKEAPPPPPKTAAPAAPRIVAAAAPAPRIVAVTTPAPAVVASPARPPAPKAATAQSSGEVPGHGMRVAGVALGAVGVVGVAAGAFFGLQAKSAASDLTAAARAGQTFDPGREADGKSANTRSLIGFAAGGAFLLTGVLLYALSPSAAEAEHSRDAALEVKF